MTVVLAFPTVMDGLVLRWYKDEAAAEDHREFMSVSRNGAEIYCPPSEVPSQAAADAVKALELFRLGREDDVKRLATHRRKHFMRSEIEPILEANHG